MKRKISRATHAAAGPLMIYVCSDAGASPDYRVQEKAGGLTFDVTLSRIPPVLGNNEIRIGVKDAQ